MKIHIVNTMQNLTSQLTKRVSNKVFLKLYSICKISVTDIIILLFLDCRILWAWQMQTMPLHCIMLSFEQLRLKLE